MDYGTRNIDMSGASYLCLVPVLSLVVILTSTITTYVFPRVSVVNSTMAYLPYPSDLGDTQPMAGVKIIGVATSSALTFTVMLLRHLQANNFYPQLCVETNIISFVVGLFMLLGECVVAVYSLNDQFVVHYIGIALYFGCGCMYMIMHAHISRKHPFNHPKCLTNLRITFSAFGCLCPLLYALSRLLRLEFRFHIPQISAWVMHLLIHVYICTFAWDFGRIRLTINSTEISPTHTQGTKSLIQASTRKNDEDTSI